MQEAALRAEGRKAFYLPFDMNERDYRKVLSRLPQLVLSGFNVTVPYKEITARALPHKTPEARAVGAVNTVFRRGQRWMGANTDIDGFCRAVEKDARFRIQNKTVLVLGAGGAARAVVYGLASRKAACVRILNRHEARAVRLAREFKALFPSVRFEAGSLQADDFRQAFDGADLIVNSTSVGMQKKDPVLFPVALIPKAGKRPRLFYDLIYRPVETPFLHNARRKGHKTLNGLSMLAYQGARAFEYWTGKKAPEKLMLRILTEALKQNG